MHDNPSSTYDIKELFFLDFIEANLSNRTVNYEPPEEFKHEKYNQKLIIESAKPSYQIIIQRVDFFEEIHFIGNKFKKLTFIDCVFHKPLLFYKGKIKNELRFENCQSKELQLKNLICTNGAQVVCLKGSINQCTILSGVYSNLFLYSHLNKLNIADFNSFLFVDVLKIRPLNTSSSFSIDIINGSFNRILLDFKKSKNVSIPESYISDVKIYNIFVHDITLKNINNHGLNFEFIEIKTAKNSKCASIKELFARYPYIKIGLQKMLFPKYNENDLYFEAYIELISENDLSQFILDTREMLVTESNNNTLNQLGLFRVKSCNITFRNCQIDKFSRVTAFYSDLRKIKLINSSFAIHSFIPKRGYKRHETSDNAYDNFIQFKEIAERDKNVKDVVGYNKALKFFLLRAYKEKKFESKFSEILSLQISQIFSDFGTSWSRAVVVTLILSLLFYSFNMSFFFLQEETAFNFNFNSIFAYYLHQLNPTHKITYMDSFLGKTCGSENSWFVFWDLIGRVIVAIGIYETIKSFRKYSLS